MQQKYEEAKAKIAARDPETTSKHFKANFALMKSVLQDYEPQIPRRMRKSAAR